ncbi:hypothetical protein M409DRAFT_53781 [Zasmidium cellare ATCC 36951]|uniref:Uncharacterized protein n=1 Tax=Zasmidium cellare ATCC 36951 TaxID=1080233 RepID=A0A6A6CNK5_ZASCE|nr:uncharacterized protein M409DRAFT_53781 [Zasmidium cellare ATCC 36951]KAF2167818.1 hypothetical protein M409DRAFT_53781 [Zasmidium cellare ATCC 36951]
MSSSTSRAFNSSGKAALKWVGATKNDVLQKNPGSKGQKVLAGIENVESQAEKKYGSKASYIQIQGSKLHKSSKDPNEKLDVVTVSIHTEKGTRLESDHVREDGTSTQKTTRSGGK